MLVTLVNRFIFVVGVGPQCVSAVFEYAEKNAHVKRSLDIIRQALESYNYDATKFAIGFNGGKDCTVLLHLVHCVLVSWPSFVNSKAKLNTVFIKVKDSFPEVEEFVKQSIARYNLHLLEFEGPCYKRALSALKASATGSEIDAIFMGTRSSDINYPLAATQRTDPGWPDFLRVNPLLDWSYHDIWSFLLDLNVPYCPLYDRGYTSLGDRNNTFLNPRLRSTTASGEVVYLPAYRLDDPNLERTGRSK